MRQARAASANEAAARPTPKEAYFLYGSQTGTAEEIAKGLAADAAAKGVAVAKGAALALNDVDLQKVCVRLQNGRGDARSVRAHRLASRAARRCGSRPWLALCRSLAR